MTRDWFVNYEEKLIRAAPNLVHRPCMEAVIALTQNTTLGEIHATVMRHDCPKETR